MCSNHHLSELSVNSFENFRILGKLLPDIFWSNKDIDQNTPIFLHFKPLINHHINSAEFLPPVLDSSDKVLYVFALCLHSHQVQWVCVKNLHHIVKWSDDIVLLVSVKCENLFGPVALNDLEFLVDFELLLSYINDLLNLRL